MLHTKNVTIVGRYVCPVQENSTIETGNATKKAKNKPAEHFRRS